MLKLRLKKVGRKRQPSYRLVVMTSETRRDGRPVDEVGFYSPITKQSHFEVEKITKWLQNGAQPTETVASLLKKANIIQD
jgi:small subunit ribosomal protein S16|uniref:ribosomal protein S16 n=1 Tax=Guinardia delicatula TaxID=1244696 RepID=UPI0022F30A8E|nr:ribosomal protein S16 [Guinardia delicatula]WAJ58127.1 ribosomal protein S16 [Guinardia delicatula]